MGAASSHRVSESPFRRAHGKPAATWGSPRSASGPWTRCWFEKSYRMVGTELSIEYAALESDLGRFVHLNKADFIGRGCTASLEGSADTPTGSSPWRCATSQTRTPWATTPCSWTASWSVGPRAGTTGSGSGRSLALAMVRPELAEIGTTVEMDILGTAHRATVIPESPYDPENERLRGLIPGGMGSDWRTAECAASWRRTQEDS